MQLTALIAAVLIAQANASAVFPAAGQTTTYTIASSGAPDHSATTTITLHGGEQTGPPDPGMGMSMHVLKVCDQITSAAAKGEHSVDLFGGPDGHGGTTLALVTSGSTVTADGVMKAGPPPPDHPAMHNGPMGHHGDMHMHIVISLNQNLMQTAHAEMTPVNGNGPHMVVDITRKSP